MISPVYTPFTGAEVCDALQIGSEEYRAAVVSGALQRSVHYDGRVSQSTALHSLVDVVRFDVIYLKYASCRLVPDHQNLCEMWLDGLCDLLEEEGEDAFHVMLRTDHSELIARLEPENADLAPTLLNATWDTPSTLLFDIVESWCHCLKQCFSFLIDDRRHA